MIRRLIPVAISSLVIVTGGAVVNPMSAQSVQSASSSAVTLKGSGEFSSLAVTVSQTKDLVNQIVKITWIGGTPTKPDFGGLNINYIQIMQCWGGTEQDGPPREQCQYGTARSATGGDNTASRQMTTSGVIDPLEDKYEEYRSGALSYIPFDSFTGKRTTGPRSEFFDRNTSNESNHNRIRADGTGEEFFEIQTGVEAPGLGCGQVRNGETPLCWLVIVPRGSTEVDGEERGKLFRDPLNTSPLLASNWANRIIFPLEFQPVGASCAIAATEVPLLGSDRISEAVSRWQPALCQSGQGNFSFTVLSDVTAREQLRAGGAKMMFLNYGVDPKEEDPRRPIVYAPLATSGLTIAFNVQSQSSSQADPKVRARDGERLDNIKMTPRLVAKLLTQTYRFDAVPRPDKVANNPLDLAQDPEFLALNPQFKELRFPGLGRTLTTIGQTDSARMIWEWIWADKEARSFLQGKPDQWGTVVNPDYKRGEYPRSDFPRTDNTCMTYTDRVVPVCTFDLFPFAGDLAAASRAASRGETLSRGLYDPTGIPPGYRTSPPQEPGRRAIIVISDTPLSDRFSLTPAALRNAAGEFVTASEQSMRIAAQAAQPTGAPGITQPDPARKVKGAYPLTSVTYAAVVPAYLSKEQAATYSEFITFAATRGQGLGNTIGSLPFGYVPLDSKSVKQAQDAAQRIIATAGVVGPPPPPTPTDPPPGLPGDSGLPGGGIPIGGGGSFPGSSGGGGFGSTDEVVDVVDEADATDDAEANDSADTSTEPVDSDAVVAQAAVETLPTPAAPVGSIRYVAIILLMAGGLALLTAILLGRVVGRRT